MALSVVDLYSKVLPKTNCGDCGFKTCIAFAGMVVSEKHPLKNCPHIEAELLEKSMIELEEQYKAGKWLKKDMAAEALEWAKQRAASMTFEDIAERIGGTLILKDETEQILLPYFDGNIIISTDGIADSSGRPLTRNEQTFVYIHMAQGGSLVPTGNMKSFKEFPNTVSKIVSMTDHVETPIKKTFTSNLDALKKKGSALGGENVSQTYSSCDLAVKFTVFPRVPIILLFWDAKDGFDAEAKLLFDETVTSHLDIEAIMFLSEQICSNLVSTESP